MQHVGHAVAIVAVGAAAVYGGVQRFADPTLTETQLFLQGWPIYLGALVVGLGALVVGRLRS